MGLVWGRWGGEGELRLVGYDVGRETNTCVWGGDGVGWVGYVRCGVWCGCGCGVGVWCGCGVGGVRRWDG